MAAIILPAEKRDGVRHVHGFLRVPTAARTPLSVLTVHTNGSSHAIAAPQIIARFVHHVRRFAQHAPTSFHLTHYDARGVDLGTDRDRRWRKLSYLVERGQEVRSWDLLELVPGRVWRRVMDHRVGPDVESPFP